MTRWYEVTARDVRRILTSTRSWMAYQRAERQVRFLYQHAYRNWLWRQDGAAIVPAAMDLINRIALLGLQMAFGLESGALSPAQVDQWRADVAQKLKRLVDLTER